MIEFSNSRTELLRRIEAGQITWKWPVLMVFARLLFALIAQALVALLYFARSAPSPWQSAAPWWPVYGTVIDLGCLALLVWLSRKEGIRISDLAHADRRRRGRDLLLGVALFFLSFPVAMGGIFLSGFAIFGTLQPPSVYGPLPLWAALYGLLLFPVVWGVAEQMTYQGYALPRLEALSQSKLAAISLVTFGWAIQHIALPLTLDLRFMLFRFVSFLPLAVLMTLLYLRSRRLLPFIVAHWALDFAGVLTGVILPMFMVI